MSGFCTRCGAALETHPMCCTEGQMERALDGMRGELRAYHIALIKMCRFAIEEIGAPETPTQWAEAELSAARAEVQRQRAEAFKVVHIGNHRLGFQGDKEPEV